MHTAQVDGHIALVRSDQHARIEAPVLERFNVGALRVFVTGAADDVAAHFWRHRRRRLRLEFLEPKGVLRLMPALRLAVQLSLVVGKSHRWRLPDGAWIKRLSRPHFLYLTAQQPLPSAPHVKTVRVIDIDARSRPGFPAMHHTCVVGDGYACEPYKGR